MVERGAEGLPHPETFRALHQHASAHAGSAEALLDALGAAAEATRRSRARAVVQTGFPVWWKHLRRRSQRILTADTFYKVILARYPLPPARAVHSTLRKAKL